MDKEQDETICITFLSIVYFLEKAALMAAVARPS
jgi:hypothetical protein